MRNSRIMMSTGTLPSPRIDQMATSHPFVQQIDLVFASSAVADQTFSSLETTYTKAQFTLSELYEHACRLFPTRNVPFPFKALPLGCEADDTWCIDPRGILTLCVSKRLYERLGVVGKKLAFKGCPEQFVIHIPLQRETASVAVRERQRTALKTWDSIRAESGLGKWEVAYVGEGHDPHAVGGGVVVEVKARLRHDTDVYIPVPELPESADESVEDRQQRLGSLFEWAGMACLGAQRLKANDRVDPYVAVYEAPSPSRIGNITHVRWRGLMDGGFVQSVIGTAISSSISIIMHSNVTAPVSYVPSSAPGVSEASDREAPLRVPSREAEDTSCLIVSCTSGRPTWALGQSIGKWDARWG
ncbi:ribonuclease P 40kDa subunit-domain-containing protein [Melanogaster broomeanus]|nr:ribonuclease P 40kDa subunit-domain-containing protein [Melanogaster broomeanus]